MNKVNTGGKEQALVEELQARVKELEELKESLFKESFRYFAAIEKIDKN